eukprot:jgi/Ulvmu1/3771/UM176_0005.1
MWCDVHIVQVDQHQRGKTTKSNNLAAPRIRSNMHIKQKGGETEMCIMPNPIGHPDRPHVSACSMHVQVSTAPDGQPLQARSMSNCVSVNFCWSHNLPLLIRQHGVCVCMLHHDGAMEHLVSRMHGETLRRSCMAMRLGMQVGSGRGSVLHSDRSRTQQRRGDRPGNKQTDSQRKHQGHAPHKQMPERTNASAKVAVAV